LIKHHILFRRRPVSGSNRLIETRVMTNATLGSTVALMQRSHLRISGFLFLALAGGATVGPLLQADQADEAAVARPPADAPNPAVEATSDSKPGDSGDVSPPVAPEATDAAARPRRDWRSDRANRKSGNAKSDGVVASFTPAEPN